MIELLSEQALVESEPFFGPMTVKQLVEEATCGAAMSETEDMALIGVLSPQLLHQQFVKNPKRAADTRLEPLILSTMFDAASPDVEYPR